MNRPLLLWCGLAVLASFPAASSQPATATEASPRLKSFLGTLCVELKAEACRPVMTQVDGQDLLTVVLADLAEREPAFEELISRVMGKAAPTERKKAIEAAISEVLGTTWTCPTFDELWKGQRPACR